MELLPKGPNHSEVNHDALLGNGPGVQGGSGGPGNLEASPGPDKEPLFGDTAHEPLLASLPLTVLMLPCPCHLPTTTVTAAQEAPPPTLPLG